VHKAILKNMLELDKSNKISGLENVKKIYVTAKHMSIENYILTPTMKIKRNIAKIN